MTSAADSCRTPLVEAEGVSRAFRARQGLLGRRRDILAVREVDLTVARREAVGVVGESGCGKSTLGRLLLHLLKPTAGTVRFDGRTLAEIGGDRLRTLRRRMQLIFQDPYGSLDPRRTVGDQIADGMLIHGLATPAEARERVAGLLSQVGLDPAHAARLPHEFSGGQRQRVAIARALATGPDFVVADEPVSALDVSIQAQVVNLLADLRESLGLALVFISHDLHVVRHLCDRVAVMYLGRVVETGPAAAIFAAPAHPYTRALLAATPSLVRRRDSSRAPLAGELPSPSDPPSGCGFRTRCPFATTACAEAVPPLEAFGGDGRQVACVRVAEIG
ncbi:ABC transporter ATP-binding protein [Thalassobaculum fulvum]|uniref:ABC transporter ATP-binding protein n=1 Tax=Thalassobaculum fulvum TaxID=1633335 RepID=A0A919CS84_9PROT|nr:oligopeptide/dipeptide ABC transporter ATP-binding protein [Thalassobaculum fulvum]GHD61199.1 ABC transporter ATP-binding protein [Thalassobaculum fulvum]